MKARSYGISVKQIMLFIFEGFITLEGAKRVRRRIQNGNCRPAAIWYSMIFASFGGLQYQ
jgi:hypothetical protein